MLKKAIQSLSPLSYRYLKFTLSLTLLQALFLLGSAILCLHTHSILLFMINISLLRSALLSLGLSFLSAAVLHKALE